MMGDGSEPGIALQLYTVREAFAQDPEGTAQRLGQIGYEAIEVAGTGDIGASDLRTMFDRAALQSMGTHVGLQAVEDDLQGQIERNRALGAEYITTAFLTPDERNDPEGLGRRMNEIGRQVREAGLTFSHHNHAFEFDDVNGTPFLDRLLAATDPENVSLELDVFWVIKAGADPYEYFRRYAGRIPLVHVKDMTEEGTFADVGEGVLDIPALCQAATEAGARWLIVENDQPGPQPMEAVATSLANLRQMGIAS